MRWAYAGLGGVAVLYVAACWVPTDLFESNVKRFESIWSSPAWSADGGHVAYMGPRHDSDTIFVASTSEASTGGEVAVPTGEPRPTVLALSPTGGRLLYGLDAGVYLTSVPGTHHELVWRSESGRREALASQVVWKDDGPHLLVALVGRGDGTVTIHDIDAESGERRRLRTVPRYVSRSGALQLARSQDGRSFAVWAPVEVVHESVEETTHRYRLYVHRPGDPQMYSWLELTASEGLRWLEFSPDGSEIALLHRGDLRVVDLQP